MQFTDDDARSGGWLRVNAVASVRRATERDLGSLSRVDKHAVPGSERSARLRELIGGCRCWVAELSDGAVAGYVAIAPGAFFGRDFVELLMVAPDARCRGIGVLLLRTAFDGATSEAVFTSTNESNRPMRALLAHEGWTLSGVLDGLDEGDPEFVYYLAR